MKAALLAIVAVAGSSYPAFAQADTPWDVDDAEVYEPQGLWSLSSAGEGCSVRRDFARADQQISLVMQRMHPDSEIQFGLFGNEIARRLGVLRAGFVPSAELGEFERMAEASIGETPGLVFSGPLFPEPSNAENGVEGREQQAPSTTDPDNPEQLASNLAGAAERTEYFVAEGAIKRPIALHTYAIGKALQALDGCLTGKLAEMGVSQEIIAKTAKPARPVDTAQWAEKIQERYQREALRSGFDGRVPVRLVIGPDGSVTHCHVMNQMTAKVLREAACSSLIEHARFEPARDATGSPLAGLYRTTIQYVVQRSITVGADGVMAR